MMKTVSQRKKWTSAGTQTPQPQWQANSATHKGLLPNFIYHTSLRHSNSLSSNWKHALKFGRQIQREPTASILLILNSKYHWGTPKNRILMYTLLRQRVNIHQTITWNRKCDTSNILTSYDALSRDVNYRNFAHMTLAPDNRNTHTTRRQRRMH